MNPRRFKLVFPAEEEGAKPSISFSEDVWKEAGGYRKVKEKLQSHAVSCFSEGASRILLLYGPDGCGKTFLSEKLAEGLGASFIKLDCRELAKLDYPSFRKKLSETIKSSYEKPSVLFFDNLEALFPKEIPPELISHSKLLEIKLKRLKQTPAVLVVCATDRPDELGDSPFKEKLFDDAIYIGLPSEDERVEIFEVCCSGKKISRDINFKELAKASKGATPADIAAICIEADLEVSMNPEKGEAKTEDFLKIIERVRSAWLERRTFEEEKARIESLLKG